MSLKGRTGALNRASERWRTVVEVHEDGRDLDELHTLLIGPPDLHLIGGRATDQAVGAALRARESIPAGAPVRIDLDGGGVLQVGDWSHYSGPFDPAEDARRFLEQAWRNSSLVPDGGTFTVIYPPRTVS